MRCFYLLLASERDEFGQGIREGLEGCECYLHGKHVHGIFFKRLKSLLKRIFVINASFFLL